MTYTDTMHLTERTEAHTPARHVELASREQALLNHMSAHSRMSAFTISVNCIDQNSPSSSHAACCRRSN